MLPKPLYFQISSNVCSPPLGEPMSSTDFYMSIAHPDESVENIPKLLMDAFSSEIGVRHIQQKGMPKLVEAPFHTDMESFINESAFDWKFVSCVGEHGEIFIYCDFMAPDDESGAPYDVCERITKGMISAVLEKLNCPYLVCEDTKGEITGASREAFKAKTESLLEASALGKSNNISVSRRAAGL